MNILTVAQAKALGRLYSRHPDGAQSYSEFRGRASYFSFLGCVGITWCNMFVGIEQNGYSHT